MEKDKELSPEWELAFEGKAFSRFHKVLPMVAICSEQDVIEIYNYRSHKLISLFDIKAFMNLNEQRPGRPFLPVDLIFYDKPSIVWNTSGTDVATFTNQSIPNHQESYLFVVDANSLLRWDIKDSKHVQVDLITDRKQRIVQGMLYDETSLILAYDDGQLKLFDIKAMNIILCLQGHHKSEIIDMLVFSRENSSKPLVVALDKSGQTICWNVQSGKPAFKLSENNKQKQQGTAGGKKDEPKGLLYNRFFSIFLIYTESSISIWNGFTGFKMVEIILQYENSPIRISSVAPSKCFFNSISGYMLASESGLYYFDVVDETNILALPQNRMIKVSKLLAEINISAIKVRTSQEPSVLLDRGLQTGYLRYSTAQSISVEGISHVPRANQKPSSAFLQGFDGSGTAVFEKVKEKVDSSGFVKSLSTDEILEIVRTESEDFDRERERVAPKLIFLNLVSNQITANMAEVYTEVSGQVEYMTVSTTLYCNSFPYRDCRTEFSFNGEYLMVVEKTARRVQIFHVNNNNLREEGEGTSSVTFLHPLGTLERIFEGEARDAVWNKHSLELVVLRDKVPQPLNKHSLGYLSCAPGSAVLLSFYRLDEAKHALSQIKEVEREEPIQCLHFSLCYEAFTRTGEHFDFTSETPINAHSGENRVPNDVLVSIEQRTVFYLFDKEIECVQLRPLLGGLREERTVSRVSLGHQIISSFLWEDVLFFADLYSVWMYFPSILGKEPQKVCIATNIADPTSPIKPMGSCFIVGLVDRKLLLVNNELEIIPLEITEPCFAFYLLLKNNEKECIFDSVKSADYSLQETYARIALHEYNFDVAIKIKSFGVIVTNGWKEILADLQNESDENVALKVIKHIQAVANFLNSQQKVKLTGDIDMFLKNYKEGKLRIEMEEVVE